MSGEGDRRVEVGGALLDGVDLESEQDDGVLQEGAEHEEDAGDDPGLEIK